MMRYNIVKIRCKSTVSFNLEDNRMRIIINRDAYLSRLIDKKSNGPIKVITGIRRCGKSYLRFFLKYSLKNSAFVWR